MKVQEFKKAMQDIFGDRYIDGGDLSTLDLTTKKQVSQKLRKDANDLVFQGSSKQKVEGFGMLKVLDELNLDNKKVK
jgi:hypothetical protein